MKKKYKLENLDCANCAAKMEEGIRKIKGVNEVTVSFMSQRLMLDADDAGYNDVLNEVVKTCKKIEPDCKIIL